MAQTFLYLHFESIVLGIDGKKGWSELANVGINNCPATRKATAILDRRARKEIAQAGHGSRKHLVAVVGCKRRVDSVRTHVTDSRRQCPGNFTLNAQVPVQ